MKRKLLRKKRKKNNCVIFSTIFAICLSGIDLASAGGFAYSLERNAAAASTEDSVLRYQRLELAENEDDIQLHIVLAKRSKLKP